MTPTTEAPAASAPAYSDWQGATGEGWAANAGHYETMLADVGAALLDYASFVPGERVVEIGCGSGQFAQQIAAAVAPGGTVLGLDYFPGAGPARPAGGRGGQDRQPRHHGSRRANGGAAGSAVRPAGVALRRHVLRRPGSGDGQPPCHAGARRTARLRGLGWHQGQPLGRCDYGGGAHPPGPAAARPARTWPICVQRRGLSSHPACRGRTFKRSASHRGRARCSSGSRVSARRRRPALPSRVARWPGRPRQPARRPGRPCLPILQRGCSLT